MTTHDVASFEFMFVVEGITDAFDPRIELVEAHLDCVLERHSELTLVTLAATGTSAYIAGVHAVHILETAGIRVTRTYADLVTRQDIADRAEVTRQAVGNWVRGERCGTQPFPAPTNLAAGGLWLWRDVNKWLAARGLEHDSTDHLSLDTLAQIDAWLSSRSCARTADASVFSEIGYIANSPRFAHAESSVDTTQFEQWTVAR
ncbi:hypothetical protein ACFVAV_22525 [Nocardia sp. NPDC057663]|uniref:hypothetical protein n=1 Tax=Nocardia sp. NPDC057663 TaxID=3346201 RepID=UPI00366BAC7B